VKNAKNFRNFYQPYSVPAMADPAPLEKRLRHILFGRGGYTMRHAVIPLVLGVIALGALLPLRFKTSSQSTVVEAVAVSDVAVAQAAVAPMSARDTVKTEPAQEDPESVEVLKQHAMQLEAELSRTRQELDVRLAETREHTFRVPFRTPDDGAEHRMRLDIQDGQGMRTAYEKTLPPDTRVDTEVVGVGRPIRIKLYDNDTLKASTRPVK
jgi:hypothetical protein